MSEMLASLEHLVRKHPAGTILFREGERGSTMYVLRSGKVKIWKIISDTERMDAQTLPQVKMPNRDNFKPGDPRPDVNSPQ